MEVKQPDSTTLPATLLKVTDNSIYTVGKWPKYLLMWIWTMPVKECRKKMVYETSCKNNKDMKRDVSSLWQSGVILCLQLCALVWVSWEKIGRC